MYIIHRIEWKKTKTIRHDYKDVLDLYGLLIDLLWYILGRLEKSDTILRDKPRDIWNIEWN